MKLDEAQQAQVKQWLNEGLKLSEIQDRLATEFGLQMTYMEVRFLLDDLKVKPKDKEPPPTLPASLTQPATAPQRGLGGVGPAPSVAPEEPDLGGEVSVQLDQVARPGAVVSGKVTFSDGNVADWSLDQLGRLGLSPKVQGYRPSQEDLYAFQARLQDELARMGY